MKAVLAAVSLTFAAVLLTPPAGVSASDFIAIDVPDSLGTVPTGINDRGHVTGVYLDTSGKVRSFLLRNGIILSIDVPGAEGTFAEDINNRDEVVGDFTTTSGTSRGFVWVNGVFNLFDAPDSRTTFVSGNNDHGHIAGSFTDLNGKRRGFILAAGEFTPLDFPEATETFGRSVNDLGQVIGTYFVPHGSEHSFIYEHGSYRTLSFEVSVQQEFTDKAMDNNNRGCIAGMRLVHPGEEPIGAIFICKPGPASVFVVPGARVTGATSVNAANGVVGFWDDPSGRRRGFRTTVR